ncbi:3-isopropylmalate dehydratase large subunit [Salinigranum halophilum]|uniref:3-isopropylmalate dehydratase large subunit n=1 Tax=Salinigranum halophilum TaxID=2565931 RepID=UPI0010A8BA9B|nr:aconitase/3-isopropylmalate dehydratase large subunit family protein [Salinigranum halophilum]
MGKTASEKAFAAASGNDAVSEGDTVEASIDVSWVHETQYSIFSELFEKFGGDVWDTEKAVLMVDHTPNPTNETQARQVNAIYDFADQNGMDVVEVGIKHQAWRMLGKARPGAIMAGPDSHTPTAGALGAFATTVGPTDTAVIWNSGTLWLEVPGTRRFSLSGELSGGVTARDVGFEILDRFGQETDYFARDQTIEYDGPAVREMGLDGRQTLCNMAVEMGAMATYIEPDERLKEEYLDPKVTEPYEVYQTDEDADYVEHEIDISGLEPKVAYPHSPSNVHDVSEAAGIDIDQVFIGSCANGMLDDLRLAAEILDGREIDDDVRFIVTPASDEIRKQASAAGYLDTLIQAGARVMSNYCSVCVGYEGVLDAGERCLSTNTRNYRGRMGHRDSEIYLGSPAVAAATAIAGEIADPRAVGQ